MDYEKISLTPQDLLRIGGFMGCDKGTFAEKLGVSPAYLSRVLKGKDALSAKLCAQALQLLQNYIKEHSDDLLSDRIRDLYISSMSKEQRLSLPFLRKLWTDFTREDFYTLSQRKRTYRWQKRIEDKN